jgi:hypothetical protein
MGRQSEGHSAKANSDLSGLRGRIMKVVGVDLVDVVSSTTDRPTGVLLNDPSAGQIAQLQLEGIAEVVADGSGTAIAVNDLVGHDTTGRVVRQAANAVNVTGHALDPCSVAGGTIRVVIRWGR